jgi:hypothetical protein
MLQRRGRVGYRMLKRQFQLDEEALEDLKAELIEVGVCSGYVFMVSSP